MELSFRGSDTPGEDLEGHGPTIPGEHGDGNGMEQPD
jgi:hypothetical protein